MRKSAFVLAVSVLTLAVLAGAQTSNTGAIAGLVTDASGAAVPGATVTVINSGTGAAAVLRTQRNGNYTAPLLLPGAYSVEISAQGFTTAHYPQVQVNVAETETLNAKLALGSEQQTVTVTAQG
ncbi:MAG: carboxypeptidase-like regulatory domain-containing protein, partial [Terriglobales bacterium]